MSSIDDILAEAQRCHQAGDSQRAEALYRQVLAANPAQVRALGLLAELCQAQGRLAEAAQLLEEATHRAPHDALSHNALGAVLGKRGDFDAAESCFRRAIQLDPRLVAAHFNLATVAFYGDRLDEAEACCRQAIALEPRHVAAHNTLGAILIRRDRPVEAAACFHRVLQLAPRHAQAHFNLATIASADDRLDEAEWHARQAIALQPVFPEAYNTLAGVLFKRDQLDEAASAFRRALEQKPDHVAAVVNLAIVLAQQDRVAEARACYDRALELEPGNELWRLSRDSLCPVVLAGNRQIDAFRENLQRTLESTAARGLQFEPAALATSDCRPSFNLQFQGRDDRPLREAYARVFRPSFSGQTAFEPLTGGQVARPRIGFVVTDRHEGLFLRSLAGVLERMDQDRFELVVLGSHRMLPRLRARIANPAVAIWPLPKKFEAMAEAIRAARFDLLYYWEVGTDATNYFLPYLRLAPVQCTSWGIQVTSGIPELDYYLSSELAEPPGAAEHYTEELILASTLLTYQRRAVPPQQPRDREFFGLAAEQHIYLCAQQLGKFHPDFDPILAGILRRDPRGVVAITADRFGGADSARQLRERFAANLGDVARRVVFVPFQPTADYLSLVAAADVLLDPLHFGGVNSTYDGLSLNQPIVTLPGHFQRGRYTLACYRKMGITDCLADSAEQYVEIAVRLATEPDFRREVVERIRQASPLLFEDSEAVREHERIFGQLIEASRSAR